VIREKTGHAANLFGSYGPRCLQSKIKSTFPWSSSGCDFRSSPPEGLLIKKRNIMKATEFKHINFFEDGDWSVGAPELADNKRELVTIVPISEQSTHIALIYDNGRVGIVPQWEYLGIKEEQCHRILRNGYCTKANLVHAVEVQDNAVMYIVRENGNIRACAHSLNKIDSTSAKTSMGKKLTPKGLYILGTFVLDKETKSKLIGNYDATSTKDRGRSIVPADLSIFSSLLGYRLSA